MNAPIRIYVPRDAALAVDADAVARAIEAAAAAPGRAAGAQRLSRTAVAGTHGGGRHARRPRRLQAGAARGRGRPVRGRLAAGRAHPLRLGPTEDIPYLKHQERLTFARVGVTDPLSLQDYAAHGGLETQARAVPGARGHRPGTHRFRTARPWRRGLPRHQMEDGGRHAGRPEIHRLQRRRGDSGTYADRLLMEGDPYVLIEGMTIAGLAVGATGLHLRALRIPARHRRAGSAIARRARSLAGRGCARQRPAVRPGSAQGRRRPSAARDLAAGKPGRQARRGARQAAAAGHLRPVRQAHRDQQRHLAGHGAHHPGQGRGLLPRLWRGRSHGTLPFQLAGNLKHGGLVENLRPDAARDLLCASAAAAPRAAARCRLADRWAPARIAMGRAAGLRGLCADLGHDRPRRPGGLRRHRRHGAHGPPLEFCAIGPAASAPCRIGSTRGVETLDKIMAGGPAREQQVHLLRDLCNTMLGGSLCALGGMAPPVLSALNHFPRTSASPPVPPPPPARPDAARPETAMLETVIKRDRDLGTPPASPPDRHPDHRWPGNHRARRQLADARGRRGRHQYPQALRRQPEPFGSCRLCLVQIDGRRGYPASCTTPAEHGSGGAPRRKLRCARRHGAVHLRPPAGLPDLSGQWATASCRTWPAWWPAGALRLPGRQPPGQRQGRVQSVLHLRPVQVHRLQPLRARLRETRAPTPDHLRQGLRIARVARPGPAVPGQRMRVLRRLRAGLPTSTLQEKTVIMMGQAEHSVVTTCAYCGVGCGSRPR